MSEKCPSDGGDKAIRGYIVKLHNRRVLGALTRNGLTQWRFKMLDHGEVKTTRIALSQEALRAMFSIAVKLEVL